MGSAEGKRVVVAMSGGVDSSVAALLLKEAGHDAIGVSMQVWDYRNNGGCSSRATCCAPDDFTDARRVAAQVGIPYYVFDFEEYFREAVIDTFVRSYERGVTPNPCVDCNSKVKFKQLRERCATFGCDYIATGHYATIEERDDGFHLMRGRDDRKDQSYFLYGLTQEELASTLFPVGHLTKDEVREEARRAALPTAAKPESQDVCFVSGKLGDFLARVGVKRSPGSIVNTAGQVVGSHEGVHNFTVGQRRGLHVGGNSAPLYVTEIDSARNVVSVGEKHELERECFMAGEVTWCSSVGPKRSLEAIAQLRYRHTGVRVMVHPVGASMVRVDFMNQWSTVSPGQACVFYALDNREVLGGGRILRDEKQKSIGESLCALAS